MTHYQQRLLFNSHSAKHSLKIISKFADRKINNDRQVTTFVNGAMGILPHGAFS